MTKGLKSAKGTDTNKVAIGSITELYGDPERQIEKPYTIILGPGFDVEISRCTDGTYWVHVATRQRTPEEGAGRMVEARVDAAGRYVDLGNAALRKELERGDVNHIAFRIKPG